MPVINQVTIKGIAHPLISYPNPVLVTRAVYLLLKEYDNAQLDMTDIESIHETIVADLAEATRAMNVADVDKAKVAKKRIADLNELKKYLDTKEEEYLSGINEPPRGFEIKWYSCRMDFPGDGTTMVFREDEDAVSLVKYADAVKENFKAKGYILKQSEDKKGTDIFREVRNPMDGQLVLKRYATFRVKAVPARGSARAEDQRYPHPATVAYEKAEIREENTSK